MQVGASPIQVAVNCQLCPVLSVVALRLKTGTFASRRQLWSFGLKSTASSACWILTSRLFGPGSPGMEPHSA